MSFKRARCAHCRGKLVQERPSQIVHVECAEGWALALIAKRDREEAKRVKAQRKEDTAKTREKKEALRTIPELIKMAQAAFNAWVRARDEQQPCISCGKPPVDLSGMHAGRDAGHYRSTGSAKHLRFHEDNCHAQCVKCNQWKAGNAVDYRIGLIARIGLARVEALEADNTTHKWSREELIQIKETYRRKLKEQRLYRQTD